MAGAVSAAHEIVIRGQAEVEASFLKVRREVLAGLKPALFAAAEPVRKDAEQINVASIENIGPRWSRVRLGATVSKSSALVYLAPKNRRTKGNLRRPNLAPLLETSMTQARDDHQEEFVAALDVLVTASAADSGLL
jgi:hypothetical protein